MIYFFSLKSFLRVEKGSPRFKQAAFFEKQVKPPLAFADYHFIHPGSPDDQWYFVNSIVFWTKSRFTDFKPWTCFLKLESDSLNLHKLWYCWQQKLFRVKRLLFLVR